MKYIISRTDIEKLKQAAKKLKKIEGIPHNLALDDIASKATFQKVTTWELLMKHYDVANKKISTQSILFFFDNKNIDHKDTFLGTYFIPLDNNQYLPILLEAYNYYCEIDNEDVAQSINDEYFLDYVNSGTLISFISNKEEFLPTILDEIHDFIGEELYVFIDGELLDYQRVENVEPKELLKSILGDDF